MHLAVFLQYEEMWNKIRPEDVLNDNNINVQRTEKER